MLTLFSESKSININFKGSEENDKTLDDKEGNYGNARY
tara:strand:+ start:454 stop:567 length:114 start_codon:yes stop_codon:yes gene_type:complete